jgi:hypothetical protein
VGADGGFVDFVLLLEVATLDFDLGSSIFGGVAWLFDAFCELEGGCMVFVAAD